VINCKCSVSKTIRRRSLTLRGDTTIISTRYSARIYVLIMTLGSFSISLSLVIDYETAAAAGGSCIMAAHGRLPVLYTKSKCVSAFD
jgi:hypothetical protein